MDIAHLHLHVGDRRRAVAFYQRWLGFRVRREDDDITFVSGSQGFLLALMEDPDPAALLPAWFHFGVRLPSADAVRDLLRRMEEASVPIAKPLYEDAAFASFRCRDPDGYAIELYWEEGAPTTAPPRG